MIRQNIDVLTRTHLAMSEARPVLLFQMPANWEADLAALTKRRAFLSDGFGAMLSLPWR